MPVTGRASVAERLRWVPDALTVSRFAIVGIMIGAAVQEQKALYVTLMLLAVLTDIFDGAIARSNEIASRWGANLDSASDLAFYLAAGFCSFVWAPDLLVPLIPLVVLFIVGYLTALAISKRQRGVMGFHNRYTRLAATIAVVAAIWIALWEETAWIALLVLGVVAAVDLTQRYVRLYQAAHGGGRRRSPARLASVHTLALPRKPRRRDRA